jgi:hypothetical protein
MFLQEADEFTDLGFIRRKFPCMLGDFDKPIAVASFFDRWKEKVQFDKIDMLNSSAPASTN